MHSNRFSFPSATQTNPFSYPTESKRWADYEDDDLLPTIPSIQNDNQTSHISKPSEWITVKSKKKRK